MYVIMWFLLVLTVCCTVYSGNAIGYYRVVGPRVIRPNSEYHAAVSTQGTSVATSVTVQLVGRQDNGRVFNAEQQLVVEPYTTRVARLEVGDVEPGDYRLIARGNGGISFETSSVLNFIKKSYSVFIQTDKSVYKPGHKMLFRAIILNSGLKPAAEVRNEQITIKIADGKGNVVKQWRGITATRGVFTGDLQLSKSPVLGDWNISVNIHGQVFNKTIQVAEYKLPKFFINIQTKNHVLFKENTIVANIQSQYSYGKKVKGDATITMYPTIRSGVIQPIFQNPIRKVLPIDGSVTVEFDITKDLRLSDEYERAVIVDVIIEEALTGRRQNNSVEINIHKYDYKMELIKTADYYKPGLKYSAFIKVINNDGTPIREDRNKITIRHGYSKANEIYQEETYKLDRNGMAELNFYPPSDYITNKTALRIEAEYLDLKEWFSPVPAAVSSSKQYIQAMVLTDRPIVNQDVEVFVNCTEPLQYISYELLGRGDVIVANTLQVRNQNIHTFHFTATHAMVPTAHLIVNYVRSDGELVADSLNIEIDGLLQNFIDIHVNSNEAGPNADIDLTVRAQPNSYVGLLAVDQNVGLLKSGHDILQSEVADELGGYDEADTSPYLAILGDQRKSVYWKPGASNTRDIFHRSGAVVLTNSLVNTYRPTLEDIYLRPPQYESSTFKPDRGPGVSFQTVTRPPLAGPYAFSRIPRPVWDKPRVYLNHDIQDTWLFVNFSSGFEGKTSIRKRVPESLTTWTITGFSLDPLRGLGLISSPRKLKISKQFVVSLDLPYSVQRGEILAVPVVVYNHRDRDITAEITIHNSEQKFMFAPLSNEPNATKKIELYRKKSVTVKRNSGASVSFLVQPNMLGYTEIKVSANGNGLTDTVIQNLFVKAEGETQYYSKSILLDLRQTPSIITNLTLDIPKNVVSGSEQIEVSVVGDLLGPTIVNLERLITLPTGCGEQNMLQLIPNVIVLNYLRNTRQLTASIEREAVSNLEIGYQQQLTYRRMDGSFSAFGQMDANGSTWLTALVAQGLRQAQQHIYVDDAIISEALEWLANNQAINGSFTETGSIVHRKIQSLDGNSLALTAFTAISFIENQGSSPLFPEIVDRALGYVARYINAEQDVYTIALSAYALHAANHPAKRIALTLLENKAKENATLNYKWWGEDIPKSEEKNPWHYLPKSIDIEMTAYALLTYVEANLVYDAIPVVNWLIGQENPFGGFASTQDTIVGLQALSRLTEKMSTQTNMQVKFSYKKQESNNINVNQGNAMIVQKFKIGSNAREVNVTAQGSGLVLFRVNYQYNMNVTGPWPMFTLDPQVDKNSNRHHLQLSICTGFVSRNLTEHPESNMAVMEVNFPSGFTADVDSLPSLEVSQNVKKVETKNKDTTVILYFEKMIREEYCPTVSAFRTHKVAKQRPAYVTIYDYYDTSRKARVFYQAHTATLCDICEAEDCENVCTTNPETQIGADSDGKGGCCVTSPISSAIYLITIVYLLLICN